ncbi:hypothetical protein Fmac_002029 [Flemingia macrophylla]|uniref:Uncharacterized protein n=1 Tax=Flemingia macrophylla TaxID=520843 RepID=A0ABD1NIR6_9FABA
MRWWRGNMFRAFSGCYMGSQHRRERRHSTKDGLRLRREVGGEFEPLSGVWVAIEDIELGDGYRDKRKCVRWCVYGLWKTSSPPTPSAEPKSLLSTSDVANVLSHILHRLPPTPTNESFPPLDPMFNPTAGHHLFIANADLVYFNEKLLAMSEDDLPYELIITPSGDLKTMDHYSFENQLKSRIAHPKIDLVSDELFSLSHPDSFYLMQMIQQNQSHQTTTSLLKVELKHFILSITDDPIVSRIFAEAFFRSYDIKLALLQPSPPFRIFPRLVPPLFLCNLEPRLHQTSSTSTLDLNSGRILEVITKKTKRNPLLMGVYAKPALHAFLECIQTGKGGVFFAGLASLAMVSVENEILTLLRDGGGEGGVFQEVGRLVEQCALVQWLLWGQALVIRRGWEAVEDVRERVGNVRGG